MIPTASKKQLLPSASSYIVKPINGCSSTNIRRITHQELGSKDLKGYLIQPEIDFLHEISFYFIDNVFTYAMISAGKNHRWQLSEYRPKRREIYWALQFVHWNHLSWGLQRIDACQLQDKTLLLMEVESEMPLLSLQALSQATKERVLNTFKQSLLTHLS